jgi:hypothetical protein
MPKTPAVLSSEAENEILGVYLAEVNNQYDWNLTADEVWIEKYYGIYNGCIAVILSNKYLIPGDGVYINYELEIVVSSVSFLYGGNIGAKIVIYENGKLYDIQESYDKGMLTKEDLKSIAYYQNEGYIRVV